MRYAPGDILADLGCELVRTDLSLPSSTWDIESLRQRLTGYLPYINLTSEDARKQALVGPLLLELAQLVQSPLQIEYLINVNQYLKGDLDYFIYKAASWC